VPVEKPGHQGVWCSNCGYEFSSEPQGEPCPSCGHPFRTRGVAFSATAKGRAGIRGKARSGEAGKPGGKPWLETMSEPSWSHDRQKWLHREKTENRRDNRYTEVVKDPDTGEIVHEMDEPLTDHRGHGSARSKKDPPRE
jgi:hypothetical protein